jgi:hypothetical protein
LTDPPYNTKSRDFHYKDNFKHSSWIAMMFDRAMAAKQLLSDDGVFFHHIDENEHQNASTLLSEIFGEGNRVVDIAWKNSSKNGEAYVAMQHEYIIGAVKNSSSNKGNWKERKEGLEEIYKAFDGFKKKYGTDWKAMNPQSAGISHCFKVLKLESYEDTLNNLQLRRPSGTGDLLNGCPKQAKDDYLLQLHAGRGKPGLAAVGGRLQKPFDYSSTSRWIRQVRLNRGKIDLVETFNYLIGLRVKHIDAQPERGFVTVTGTLPSGESCLVLWRDCEKLDYEGLAKLCDKLDINPADNEYDVVYLNGDHNIPTKLTQMASEGGATRELKLRQIEPEFLAAWRMCDALQTPRAA